MSIDPLSKALAEATKFVLDLQADVRALLSALDAALERAGWVMPKGQRLNYERGEWLLWNGSRLYTPKAAGDSSNRFVFVVFHLSPPDGSEHDYATLLAAAVRFPSAATSNEVWRARSDTGAMYRATLARPDVSVLARSDFEKFTPHASAVSALALPLCSLTSEDDLRVRVVDPILKAEAALGATK